MLEVYHAWHKQFAMFKLKIYTNLTNVYMYFQALFYFLMANDKSREQTQQTLLESASPEYFLSLWKFPLPCCPSISIPDYDGRNHNCITKFGNQPKLHIQSWLAEA